jgi:hypothetical protein
MRYVFIVGCVFSITFLTAQDSVVVKKWEVRGYIKDLQILSFDKDFANLVTNNLIHNRINVKYKPTPKFTAALELRNRLYWGEGVRLTPSFSSGLRNKNEAFNFSEAWFDQGSMIFHSNVDRLWLEYRATSWNIRVGRQRINWGIGTTWNPNDLFNTFNFLNFDYEERPGSDAVKIQYLTGSMSHVELAVAQYGTDGKTIAAVRYFVNRANYDVQFIGGWYTEQVTVGLGWSGSIKDAGFKGEAQYFVKRDSLAHQVNVVLEGDYMFDNGWYVSAGGLLNNNGIHAPIINWNIVELELSPRYLMPTRWNVLGTVAKQINPLLNINMAFVYSPGTNLLMVLPTAKYNIATDFDIDLVWQSFFAEQSRAMSGISHSVFLRFKWSF